MLKIFLKLAICFGMILPLLISVNVHAEEASDTWTLSVDGEFIKTQTAYESIAILSHEEISRPEDLFINEANYLFIADSDHGHIAIFDETRELVKTVGTHYLTNPTGVFVQEDIFVADTNYIFQFSQTGDLINQFGRPESPLFGRTQHFRPRKLALDARGNIYIAGEAANNGIIQLNANGEFLGYFGANQTNLTFFQTMQRLFLGGGNFTILPTPPTNLAIADNGAVLTVTGLIESYRIRMLNIAGNNMFDDIPVVMRDAVDVTLGNQGNFYILYASGVIDEFDSSGNLLFSFGGQDPSMQRFGIIRQPTSIEVDTNGYLYVTDAEVGAIHIFSPTEFTNQVHHALAYFEEGLYTQSEDYWKEVLRLNSSFGLAHQAIGQSQFIQANYEEALVRFYLANDISGYSEAFWELRHEWLLENTGFLIGAFVAFVALHTILNQIDKRTGKITLAKQNLAKKLDFKLLREFALLKKIFKQPFDVFYEIKYIKSPTVKFATFLYIVIFISVFISLYFPGFIFANHIVENLGFILLATFFILGFGLFLVVNYLISTINDGEGSFSDIYIGTAYSMAPFIYFSIPITLISRVLTLNEGFVYTFLMQGSIIWSVILIFLMVKEIHDFSIRDTIKNLIMTMAGSMIVVAIGFILYAVIFDQIFEFIYSIIWEVLIRVQS